MNNSPKLFICIGNLEISIIIGFIDEKNNFEILEKLFLPIEGIVENKISDLDKFTNLIKKNILLIEQKINYTFKDIILILDNFEISFLNLCGFKKLNGTQISKENITYILNSLKSCVDEFEKNKKILHIFNSEYCLDKKKLDNLPIGLFGNFYSQELSFNMINKNDYKNLKIIFDKCNLKIKKVLKKSFVEGVNINNRYNNVETFFLIKINNHNSKISFFENASLKFEQVFKFGADIIISDISKITSLNKENVKLILNKINLAESLSNDEIIEKEFFTDNYRKIKKKLIYEIALARIQEISELIIFKNINLKYHNKVSKNIFLVIDRQLEFKGLNKIFESAFSLNNKLDLNIIADSSEDDLIKTTNNLVQYGWKKEAIPIALSKKSILRRFLETIFG